MDKINTKYFQKWVLNSLTAKSSRYLFFDLNDRLVSNIYATYSQSGTVNFLPDNYSLWIFSPTKSDRDYKMKGKIARISDSDLIEVRNISEENAFVVFISDLSPVIIPSDNITSVSERYTNSQICYIDYICNEIFLGEYNFDKNIINDLKRFVFRDCVENLDYCFYKVISQSEVLEFFGVIGSEKHLTGKSFNLSVYNKDFISRLFSILNKESYIGLETRLAKHKVKNYTEAIEAFKIEGFNSAKDFARNISNIFLKSTKHYKSLIDVDEWIDALKEEIEDYSIEYDDKKNEDVFGLARVNKISNTQGKIYFLRREKMHTYLTSLRESNWSINKNHKGQFAYLNILQNNEILDIKSILDSEQKGIKLINYDSDLNQQNYLDLGIKVRERYVDEKMLNINLKNDEKFIEETNSSLKRQFAEEYSIINESQLIEKDVFNKDLIDISKRNTSIFEIKDKSLFENSDLDFFIRFVSKETNIDVIILEDQNGEFKINYRDKVEVEIKTKITDYDFKDVELFLQNISFNKLFIKISNNGFSEWLIFLFTPEGTKEPLNVKNYFQKYQALNDSALSKRVISIEAKIKNDIHSYYFEDKFNFDQTYLPTIFNFEEDFKFINKSDVNPFFLDNNKFNLDSDFRPSRFIFDQLINSNEFKKYEDLRNKIVHWYKNKFLSYDIRSIDDIDFSSDEIFDISEDYLKSYYALLLINENTRWLDTFYFCEIKENFFRLENMPDAIFFSPFNPILIFQLATKMRLMRNTLDNVKRPNSISSLLKINVLNIWVIKDPTLQNCYFSVNTDSVLFTGFVSMSKLYKNCLESTLKKFNVSYSQGVGHLSYSQIKSALNKSYSYLSNKSTFNVKLEGKLSDDATNDSILDWVESKSNELSVLYNNFNLQVNIYDNRAEICYPNDNLLSYYKEEKKLNFNWFKGLSSLETFDLTLITSFIPDVSPFTQKDPQLLSYSFSFKNIISTSISSYLTNALYKDVFIADPKTKNIFDELVFLIKKQFMKELSFNQTKTLINSNSFKDSEVVAISSDISNTFILEEVVGKSLWEFSISDYSYKDNGKGDYFLLANEQEVYTSNFRKFLADIDPESNSIFEQFLTYSKKTGLFELKHLISNQNFIKGFIASVAARKIIDSITEGSTDTFIIPYDVFKNRLHKIKMEIDSNYKNTGTQFPDFILVQISKEDNRWCIDLRLIEIKYRNRIISEIEISKILNDQTNKIKKILCKLNNWREKEESEYGLWVDTLSIILTEMSQFYFNNSLKVNSVLKRNFAEAINDNYLCRINESLLISVDISADISSGSTKSGIYIKIPQSKINQIFSNNVDVIKSFQDFFESMQRIDTCETDFTSDDNSSLNESVFYQNEDGSNVNISSNVDSYANEPERSNEANSEPIFDIGSTKIIIPQIEKDIRVVFGKVENDLFDSSKIDTYFSESEMAEVKDVEFSKELGSSIVNTPPNVNNLKVVFGKDDSNREVIYYPKGKGSSPLPNYNIMVTGSSGKGKTQFIKSFIYQQGRKETSFTIIDFKNDYSDNEFCELCNLKKISVKLNGIPYNPLIPRVVKDEDTDEMYYDVSEHINGICSVLGSTFGLGDQQEAQLKRAVREVFKLSGLETKGTLKYNENISFPTFNEVGDYLDSGDKDLEKLYNRLDPLFDLNLFPDKFKNVGFENVIKESYIIKVSDIQNDKIKNAIAKLIVVSAHGYYLGSCHRSNVYKYFVFDEAHRILDSAFVEKFIRECRAFGVGVLLSSQQPTDFPNDVLGQLATKIIHGNEGIAALTKKIKDLISFGQDDRFINNLQTFEAIVNNQDYNNYIIKTLAWPHLMTLEAIKEFPLGISKDELNSHLLKRGVKGSELMNLLNTLVSKNYINIDEGKYKIR